MKKLLSIVLLLAASLCAQTRVSDIVYDARGARASGLLTLEWPAFTTAGGKSVPAGRRSYSFSSGILDIRLEPTVGASPGGTYYTARFSVLGSAGAPSELWSVPDTASAVTLAQIRVSGGATGGANLNGAARLVNGVLTTVDGALNNCVLVDGTSGPCATGSSSGHTIEDEAVALTQRSTINFTGAGVTVADAGGKTVVTIPDGGAGKANASHTHAESDVTNLVTDLAGKQPTDADLTAIAALACSDGQLIKRSGSAWVCAADDTGAGGGYATVQEEGSSLTQRNTLNFVGPRVTCVDNNGSTRTDCTVDAAASTHSHVESDVTNLVTDLAGKAPTIHTHTMAGITDLAASGVANTPAGNIAANTVQGAIDELDAEKAPSTHNHAESEVTNLVTDLAGKAASVHTHTMSQITDLANLAASAVVNTPAGNIAAATVQAAINELDGEKQPLDSDLTAIAALSCADGQIAKKNSGVWTCQADDTGAGGGYQTIQDEAVSLTQRNTLNLTGAGVTCVDNSGATRTDCTIPGGAGITAFSGLSDLNLIRNSASQLTLGTDCSTSAPCNVMQGGTVTQIVDAVTITNPSGTGTITAATLAGVRKVYYTGISALTFGGACPNTDCIAGSVPATAIPLYAWTVSAGAFDAAGGTDYRAPISREDPYTAGTGLNLAANAFSVNTSVIPSFASSTTVPGSCTAVGQFYFDTDASSGAKMSYCNGSTYEQVSGGPGGAVESVFTRTGAVVAAAGDYTASQVTNAPAGNIAAITVQAAIDELDGDKQPTDADLTAIAALSCADGQIAKKASGVWTCAADDSGAPSITANYIAYGTGSGITGAADFVVDQTNKRITAVGAGAYRSGFIANNSTASGASTGYELQSAGNFQGNFIHDRDTNEVRINVAPNGSSVVPAIRWGTGSAAKGVIIGYNAPAPIAGLMGFMQGGASESTNVLIQAGGTQSGNLLAFRAYNSTFGNGTLGMAIGPAGTYIDTLATATPTNPAAGYVRFYSKAAGEFCSLSSAGVETCMSSAAAHTHAQSEVTNLVTDLAAKQASDADLDAIAALSCADGLIMKKAAGVWTCAADDSGGAGAGAYTSAFSSSTSWSLTGATHGLATCDLSVTAWDTASGRALTFGYNSISCDAGTFDVTVAWPVSTAGRLVLIKSGGAGDPNAVTAAGTLTADLPMFGDGLKAAKVGTKIGTGTEVVMSQSPTIVTPTIASFVNATHDHGSAAGGGNTLASPILGTPTISSFASATHTHTNAANGGVLSSAAFNDGALPPAKLTTAAKAQTKSLTIFDPAVGDTNKVQLVFPTAATITRVWCSTDTGTVTAQLDERAEATPNTAGVDVLSGDLICDSNSEVTTAFANAAIAANVPLNLQIKGVASSPTVARIHVSYIPD
jgi:hypothetical protein